MFETKGEADGRHKPPATGEPPSDGYWMFAAGKWERVVSSLFENVKPLAHPETSIKITFMPDGRLGMSSLFCGRRDSTYMPFAPEELPGRVAVLVDELRQQLREVSPQ